MPPETVIGSRAYKAPSEAAAEFNTVKDEKARQILLQTITTNWIENDHSDALEWSQSLTQPNEQAAAWKLISEHWLKEDSHQASKWISSLPAGEPRDAAVLSLTAHVQDSDPDLAWNCMVDPGFRTSSLVMILC